MKRFDTVNSLYVHFITTVLSRRSPHHLPSLLRPVLMFVSVSLRAATSFQHGCKSSGSWVTARVWQNNHYPLHSAKSTRDERNMLLCSDMLQICRRRGLLIKAFHRWEAEEEWVKEGERRPFSFHRYFALLLQAFKFPLFISRLRLFLMSHKVVSSEMSDCCDGPAGDGRV